MRIDRNIEIIKTDLLIVGGGVAGMQAAVSAKETDPEIEVLVVEKADTRRSGMGSTGNDHFFCYLPQCHGDDFDQVIADALQTQEGRLQDLVLFKQLLWRSREIVEKWENYGIPMRPTGDYVFEGHSLPGRKMFSIKYDGQNQKKILTKVALSLGAAIQNHITISEVLLDDTGRAIGAVGVDTTIPQQPKLAVFQAKAVILAAGSMTRMYPSSNPAYLFNLNECPANAAGAVIGYRAGARLINYDLIGCHAGPRYFERSGKATWIGVVADIQGKPVGPFVTKASRKLGDPMSDIWPGVFRTMLENGTGPVYMDCRELSQEDMDYMKHCFVTEGLTSLNDYFEQRNIDLSKSMIEFGSYALGPGLGGLELDRQSATNVPGLYGAGTVGGNVRGSITCASVYGMIAAENAAAYCRTVAEAAVAGHPLVEQTADLYDSILGRTEGAHWKEVNSTLQNIMKDYAGRVRSETLFTAGLCYLRELRELARAEMKADNAHELMRTLEVLDILDLSEVALLCGNNRRENRGVNHNRIDYPFTNPLLDDSFQTIAKNADGTVTMAFRESIRK